MEKTANEPLIQQRKKCNLFQEQVASAVGISDRYYRKLEAGECKPNVETAISIAELLGSTVPDLFSPRRQPGNCHTQPDYSSLPQGVVSVTDTLLRAWKETTEAAKSLDPAILADGVSEEERAKMIREGREAIRSLEAALKWLEAA